jgi:hypothetical protein
VTTTINFSSAVCVNNHVGHAMSNLLRVIGKLAILNAVWVTVLVAGCKTFPTVQTYEGKQLPKQDVALVSPSPGYEGLLGGRQDVYILKVDGVNLKKVDIDSHASLEILPGEHRLTVSAMLRRDGGRVAFEDPNPITYRFEAGKQYRVYCRLSPGPNQNQAEVRFWMEDDSGKVVAGTN